MENEKMIRTMFLPKRDASFSLSTAITARSGSGKTTLLTYLVNQARNDEEFKETRFVYVSIKQETLFDAPVVKDIPNLLKKMAKEPIVSYYPTNPEWYEEEVDALIESMFEISDDVEGGIVLMIDDANILKGWDSRGQVSSSVKKLTIAGRSKGIRGVFMTHRLANLPRLMNGNLSGAILLSMSEMDLDYAKKIFGVDLENLLPELTDYRWAYVDLITNRIHRYNPITLS